MMKLRTLALIISLATCNLFETAKDLLSTTTKFLSETNDPGVLNPSYQMKLEIYAYNFFTEDFTFLNITGVQLMDVNRN